MENGRDKCRLRSTTALSGPENTWETWESDQIQKPTFNNNSPAEQALCWKGLSIWSWAIHQLALTLLWGETQNIFWERSTLTLFRSYCWHYTNNGKCVTNSETAKKGQCLACFLTHTNPWVTLIGICHYLLINAAVIKWTEVERGFHTH